MTKPPVSPPSPCLLSEREPALSLASPAPAALTISPNTQAILLLTAPLIAGRSGTSPDLLTPGEYVIRKSAVARFGAGFFAQFGNTVTRCADTLHANRHA